MSKEPPIELFMPPNMLKARVGGRFVGIDMAAIKRAEAAVADLAPEFSDWISKDVAALKDAFIAYRENPDARRRTLLTAAADELRIAGLNFGFPLISRVTTSLCNLLCHLDLPAPSTLVEAHVSAVQVIAKQRNMLDADDPTANLLAAELENQVRQCLSRSSA
ncbi:MAG: hypothetical protein KGO02_17715 [Alphaproteobacteria bacterium]|nr:hypothetical protein [Alphaproteobacteria bacterium]